MDPSPFMFKIIVPVRKVKINPYGPLSHAILVLLLIFPTPITQICFIFFTRECKSELEMVKLFQSSLSQLFFSGHCLNFLIMCSFCIGWFPTFLCINFSTFIYSSLILYPQLKWCKSILKDFRSTYFRCISISIYIYIDR